MHISQDTASEMMERSSDFLLIDLRSPNEYRLGHIPKAINIPAQNFNYQAPRRLNNKNQTILLYCESGGKSRDVAVQLMHHGYTKVYDFGGIDEWIGDIVR